MTHSKNLQMTITKRGDYIKRGEKSKGKYDILNKKIFYSNQKNKYTTTHI